MIDIKKNIIFGKGKAYSEISREVETNYKSWLAASNLYEDEFLERVNRNDLFPSFYMNSEEAILALHNFEGEIGHPLIWRKGNEVHLKDYIMDAALLMTYVVNRCENTRAKQKLTDFIKEELLPKL